MGILEDVRALYETRPYPPFSVLTPFLHRLKEDELPLLNYEAGYAACFGAVPRNHRPPRILVAGSGTFEPVAVAAANPKAQILAVDLSENSLRRLRWFLRCKGLSPRVETLAANITRLPESLGTFDYIIATGVLHHLEDPEQGLAALTRLSRDDTVFRFMVYSRWGRDLLYRAKEMARLLGITEPTGLRKMMEALPSDHPYKIYFHLYEDAKSDAGLADGYLHPCDRPFSAEELETLLRNSGLTAAKFLQRKGGNPEDCALVPEAWARMALLEATGELEENFLFFARRTDGPAYTAQGQRWNPALPKRRRAYSKLLDRDLEIGRRPDQFTAEEKEELLRALFLLPECQ